MYAAAGGASLAGRKARHSRAPPHVPAPHDPDHPAAVRAFSCTHWESRLRPPPPPASASAARLHPQPPHQHTSTEEQLACECAQGRAAWQEAAALAAGAGAAGAGGAARRCSVLGDHPRARSDHRKWPRTNRVRDASYGSSSESDGESELDSSTDKWGVARLLYAGLAILAVGLVVYFVGTGDKGFRTPALRLVGPSLIVAGLACCVLRILLCTCSKPCCACTRMRRDQKENRRLSRDGGEEVPLADRAALLSGGGGVRLGPAQCSPARRRPDTSSCDVSSISSAEEDERMRRYRTARPPPDPPPPPAPPEPLKVAPRRPREPVHGHPRGVSFARGELVLSPAQLRS